MVEGQWALLLKTPPAASAVGAELARVSPVEGGNVRNPGEIDDRRGLTGHAGPEAPLQRRGQGGVIAKAAQPNEVDRQCDQMSECGVPFGVADRIVDDRVAVLAERFSHPGQDP